MLFDLINMYKINFVLNLIIYIHKHVKFSKFNLVSFDQFNYEITVIYK